MPESLSVASPAPRLRIGDHLVSARRFTSHHGIYVGNGRVIHYGGLASGLQSGPVKASPLEDFLAGQSLHGQGVQDADVLKGRIRREGTGPHRVSITRLSITASTS